MRMTKHAHARFKQRQKIKNKPQMMRKFELALQRGTLLEDGSSKPGTLCILFNGYRYIVSDDNTTLITVFPEKRPSETSRRHLIDELRMKQYAAEAKLGYAMVY